MKRRTVLALSAVIIAALVAAPACSPASLVPVSDIAIAGSTFAEPLYVKQFDAWYQKTQVKTVYGAITSAGAIRALQDRTVDIGATDVLLSAEEQTQLPFSVLHIPTCLGAVAVCVNLPGNPSLRFDAALLSAVFRGDVKNWNDARIASLNPLVVLPDKPVVVVHRADSSGTTAVVTTYLSAVDEVWREKVGAGRIVQWKSGIGGKGNAGVTALIRQTSGSIGYVQYAYAVEAGLNCIALRNRAGAFAEPSVASIQAAVPADMPSNLQTTLLDRAGDSTYPIVSFTWLVLYREQSYDNRPRARAQAIHSLLKWLLGEGQTLAEPLSYGSLPPAIRKAALQIVEQMTWQGEAVN